MLFWNSPLQYLSFRVIHLPGSSSQRVKTGRQLPKRLCRFWSDPDKSKGSVICCNSQNYWEFPPSPYHLHFQPFLSSGHDIYIFPNLCLLHPGKWLWEAKIWEVSFHLAPSQLYPQNILCYSIMSLLPFSQDAHFSLFSPYFSNNIINHNLARFEAREE